MRRALTVVVVALAGCDGVLGLHATHSADAFIAPDAFVYPPSDDEDADNIPNETDNCPGIFNPSQVDRDHDGVGDVCDPHPDTPGDFIVSTEYFNGPTYSWTPSSGPSWALDMTGAIDTTTPPDTTNTTLTLSMSATSPTVELGFAVLVYGSDMSMALSHEFVVASNLASSPASPATCTVGNEMGYVELNYLGLLTNVSAGGTSQAIAAGQLSRFRLARDATSMLATCTVNADIAQAAQTANAAAPWTGSITVVGVKAALYYTVIYDVH